MRQPEHDRFGLGVLVFQLLMDGSHPFRSQWRGAGDPPPIEKKISQGWFPYAAPASAPVMPPAAHPTLDVLHPQIAGLVRRCFADGHHNHRQRPSAQEWEQALAAAEKALVTCNNGHYYSNHLPRCPQLRGWPCGGANAFAAGDRSGSTSAGATNAAPSRARHDHPHRL